MYTGGEPSKLEIVGSQLAFLASSNVERVVMNAAIDYIVAFETCCVL